MIPLVWTLLFAAFVVRAHKLLGRKPRPSNPDPKDLEFDLHYLAVRALFILVVVSPVLLLIMYGCWSYTRQQLGRLWAFMILYLIGMAVVFVVIEMDPRGYWNWFTD